VEPVLISPPVIVRSEGDVLVFGSLEEAACNAEWPDVEDGLYRGWDANGQLLEFSVAARVVKRRLLPGSRTLREVVVRPIQGSFAANELRDQLSRDVGRLTSQDEANRMTLPELVNEAQRLFGWPTPG
jgi:hypothetical protein